MNIEEVVKFSGLFEIIEEEGEWFFSVPLIQAMMEKDKARINGIKGSLVRWYGYEKQIVSLMTDENILEAYYKEKDISGHEIIAPYKTPNSTLIARKERKEKILLLRGDMKLIILYQKTTQMKSMVTVLNLRIYSNEKSSKRER